MNGQWRAPLVGLAALAALVAVGTTTASPAPVTGARQPTTAPLTRTTTVCPDLSGSQAGPTSMTVADVGSALGSDAAAPSVTVTALGGASRPERVHPAPAATLTRTSLAPAAVVDAAGEGAAAVVASEQRLVPGGPRRSLRSAPCLAPGTDWWLTGADGRIGRSDFLILANPGTTTANLTVTAWSSKGRIDPPRLQSFTVAARHGVRLPVADYAPDAGLVTLHVHANTGRVTAQVLDSRIAGLSADGADWLPPTRPPSTRLVVPGYPAGAGSRLLVVTNPGEADATVGLHLVTGRGNFVPAGHPRLVVPAGRSVFVDLAGSFAGTYGAVVLTSDQPVTAAGMSKLVAARLHPDLQWQPAAVALQGAGVLPANQPPFDQNVRLYLAAPAGGASVRVTVVGGPSQTVRVPAGRTVAVDPVQLLGVRARGTLVLTPVGAGEVYASRTLFAEGAHGPLVTSLQPLSLPAAVSLPPVVEDPRAAVR